jgi:adenine-specific DNA-methyltransferase
MVCADRTAHSAKGGLEVVAIERQLSATNPEVSAHKRQNGVYYTPPDVAKLLADWAIRKPQDCVLEPSFGGCAFLGAALKRLIDIGSKHSHRQIWGFDVDPKAFEFLRALDKRLANTNQFIQADFLAAAGWRFIGRRVNVIVANPPFVPYRRMDTKQRKALDCWLKSNSSVVEKDASLWAYFLQHSLNFLETGGRMAWILPSALTFVKYGSSLLNLLQRKFNSVQLVDIQEQLFVDTGTRERTVLLLCDGFDPLKSTTCQLETTRAIRFSELTQSNGWVTNTQSAGEKNTDTVTHARRMLSDCLATLPHVGLGSIANVLIGDVVGDTTFFVKTLEQWATLGISRRHLKPLLPKSSLFYGCNLTHASVQSLIDWAAAGFIDTLLRWKMKLEVADGHEKEIQPRVQA